MLEDRGRQVIHGSTTKLCFNVCNEQSPSFLTKPMIKELQTPNKATRRRDRGFLLQPKDKKSQLVICEAINCCQAANKHSSAPCYQANSLITVQSLSSLWPFFSTSEIHFLPSNHFAMASGESICSERGAVSNCSYINGLA
jgi:hypothetical protein